MVTLPKERAEHGNRNAVPETEGGTGFLEGNPRFGGADGSLPREGGGMDSPTPIGRKVQSNGFVQ
jgi:hypothetical protein